MKLSDYYNFELAMCTYFNAAHGNQSPRLKYRGEYITGEQYLKYVVSGISTCLIPKDSFIIPGTRYLDWILKGDTEFTDFLFTKFTSIVALADKLEQMNYEDMKSNSVRDKDEFYDAYTDIFGHVIGFGYPLDAVLEEYSKKQNIDVHAIPSFGNSFVKEEEMGLQQIALETDPKKQEALLLEHSLKYSWVLNNYSGFHPVSSDYFKARLSELKNKTISKEEVLETKKPTNLLEWIGFCTYIRDRRKKCNMIYNGMIDRYLKKECVRLGLSYNDAVLLTPEEFETQKETGLKSYSGVRYIHGTHEGYVDITREEWDKLISEKNGELIIKGNVASRGKVSGIAKIIITPDEFHKLNKGEILVTSMTRPEFAPILSKCAAIVTNEGGITCHAAIISREMKIPCIIATGNATQVLKDGDVVEVDAESGIVRKIG